MRRWLKLLAKFSSLKTLTLSWGAAVGVLVAYIGSLEALDKIAPVEDYGTEYVEATFPNVSELILVRQAAQETSYPPQLDKILYRFLRLRHKSGTPLQVLRHDLCSGICGRGGNGHCNSLVERFTDLVEGEVHCTKCGRTFRKGTSSLSLRFRDGVGIRVLTECALFICRFCRTCRTLKLIRTMVVSRL